MLFRSFIGTFTYVNFVLVRPPLSLGMMSVGLVYLVFLPSIITTPLGGRAVRRFGARPVIWNSLGIAVLGLAMLLSASLTVVLLGLALVAVGTFLAQAAATGYVSQAAQRDRAAASGMYLAAYFAGGLVGTVVLGRAFEALGWKGCVAGIALALIAAAWLARRLR